MLNEIGWEEKCTGYLPVNQSSPHPVLPGRLAACHICWDLCALFCLPWPIWNQNHDNMSAWRERLYEIKMRYGEMMSASSDWRVLCVDAEQRCSFVLTTWETQIVRLLQGSDSWNEIADVVLGNLWRPNICLASATVSFLGSVGGGMARSWRAAAALIFDFALCLQPQQVGWGRSWHFSYMITPCCPGLLPFSLYHFVCFSVGLSASLFFTFMFINALVFFSTFHKFSLECFALFPPLWKFIFWF